MTKTCNHHFLVNQEKGEKHVFRKSKKYRTLCSVALGTMVTAVVAWGGTVAQVLLRSFLISCIYCKI
ncbi:TPA: putative cross-wall-targeting lipoprotein signal domain-containing protein [Streptococcus suis]